MPVITGPTTNNVFFTPQQNLNFDWQYGNSNFINAKASLNNTPVSLSDKFIYGWIESWKRGSTTIRAGDPDYGKAWPIEFVNSPVGNDSDLIRYRLHGSMWDTATDSDFAFNAARFDPRVVWTTGDGALIPNGTVMSYSPITEPFLGQPLTCLFSFYLGYIDPISFQPVYTTLAKGQWIIYGNVASPITQDQ